MALSKHSKSQALTVINPQAFGSLAEIKARFLKESITDTISANLQTLTNALGRGVNSVAPRVGTLINKIAGEVLKKSNISDDDLNYFKFRINPVKLQVPKKKISDIKYTGAGYDMDIRGQELIMYSYQASTGSLVPDNLLDKIGLDSLNELFSILNVSQELFERNIYKFPEITRNPKLSDAYIKFKLFKLFWEKNDDDLLIFWEDDCYLGKFLNFNFTVDGLNPYQILYTFDFAVYPEFEYNLYTGWISESDFEKIQNRFTRYTGFNENKLIDAIKSQSLSIAEKEAGVITSDTRSDTEESDNGWFASLGEYPYNRNKVQFLKNLSLGFSTDLGRITPKQMADWYKANKDIDIFDDNISFRLNISHTSNNALSLTGQSEVQNVEEVRKEQEFKTHYNVEPEF